MYSTVCTVRSSDAGQWHEFVPRTNVRVRVQSATTKEKKLVFPLLHRKDLVQYICLAPTQFHSSFYEQQSVQMNLWRGRNINLYLYQTVLYQSSVRVYSTAVLYYIMDYYGPWLYTLNQKPSRTQHMIHWCVWNSHCESNRTGQHWVNVP